MMIYSNETRATAAAKRLADDRGIRVNLFSRMGDWIAVEGHLGACVIFPGGRDCWEHRETIQPSLTSLRRKTEARTP
jgi:hypothetical protein